MWDRFFKDYMRPAAMLLLVGMLIMPLLMPSGLAAAPEFKVLVFTKTTGFRHGSISAGKTAIQELGAAHNFAVDATEDSSLFTSTNLAQYDAVIFLLTTGDILNPSQQAAFEGYIQQGGGFVGIHAGGTDTERSWPWFGELVGVWQFNHPPGTPNADIHIEDGSHPSTTGLPSLWNRSDEWYNFHVNPRGSVHVLATLDEATYSGGTMGGDHPIAWCKTFQGGRSWYTALGHTSSTYNESLFRQHMLGGIRYAAGAVSGDCSVVKGTPYNGNAPSLPGQVELENYDQGGAGVAYNDTTNANEGNQYRSDGVDIRTAADASGYALGWTRSGEWLEYSVQVPNAGIYTIETRVAAPAAGALFHLEFNGVNKTGMLAVPNTGGWDTWATMSKTGVYLEAGSQTMRLVMDQQSSTGAVGNFNYVNIVAANPAGTTYQAENANLSGPIVQTSHAGYTGSGFVDYNNPADDYLELSINAPATGSYTLEFRYANGSTADRPLELKLNGRNMDGSVAFPSTGGWSNWQVTRLTVRLNGGNNTLRLTATGSSGTNIDSITVK